MIKNAFDYVTRKSLKSLIIMLVILAMSTLSLISLSIKDLSLIHILNTRSLTEKCGKKSMTVWWIMP